MYTVFTYYIYLLYLYTKYILNVYHIYILYLNTIFTLLNKHSLRARHVGPRAAQRTPLKVPTSAGDIR